MKTYPALATCGSGQYFIGISEKATLHYCIRPMRAEDIPQVMEIEREAFPDQWPPPSYRGELKNQLARYFVLIETDMAPEERAAPSPASRGNNRPHSGIGDLFSRALSLFSPKSPETTGEPGGKPRIVGAAGFWLMVDEAHVTTIAIRGTHRRKGLGELLLVHAIDLAIELNAQVVTLEVRVTNTVAQDLYHKYGFNKVGVRKGYYTDNGEDAFIMTTDRTSSGVFKTRFQALKQALSVKLHQDISLASKCEV
ncbi:MAG: ribosomal protein S18-alanine N-acetyltransferase [Chloroflexi bacterium]|nr:ribosomal protein S18-alanine N-acetyltransferase [Chloroflexota bacterium]